MFDFKMGKIYRISKMIEDNLVDAVQVVRRKGAPAYGENGSKGYLYMGSYFVLEGSAENIGEIKEGAKPE